MKNNILLILFLFACLRSMSQSDIIYKMDRTEVNCKVMEIDDVNKVVKYKQQNNLDGPSFSMAHSDIFMIKLSNGDTWKPKIDIGTTSKTSSDNDSKTIHNGSQDVLNTGGYNAVVIGTQTWMVENLNIDHFQNGDMITEIRSDDLWMNVDKKSLAGLCYYNNNPVNGRLYNWYAVNDPRGLAPAGWHIPSEDEWTTLINYLGGISVAGGVLKAVTFWNYPNSGATNSSGFTAIPAGFRSAYGEFDDLGSTAYFWTSSDIGKYVTRCLALSYKDTKVYRDNRYKAQGYSVRCIKD